MNIAIIGNGNIGSGLAAELRKTSHEIDVLGHGDELGGAVKSADLVILAVPFNATEEVANKADLSGKIVVDVSNPVNEDFSGLQLGHDTSAAEKIASLFPHSTVVKAFNTVFAQHYGKGQKQAGKPVQTFVAGDDENARDTVKALASEIGLEPVDAGPLKNSRYLEPLGFLNIQFGYVLGKGTDIAPRWEKAA